MDEAIAPEKPAVCLCIIIEWHFYKVVMVCAREHMFGQQMTTISVKMDVVGISETHLSECGTRELVKPIFCDADLYPGTCCQFGACGIATCLCNSCDGSVLLAVPSGVDDYLCADELLVSACIFPYGDEGNVEQTFPAFHTNEGLYINGFTQKAVETLGHLCFLTAECGIFRVEKCNRIGVKTIIGVQWYHFRIDGQYGVYLHLLPVQAGEAESFFLLGIDALHQHHQHQAYCEKSFHVRFDYLRIIIYVFLLRGVFVGATLR